MEFFFLYIYEVNVLLYLCIKLYVVDIKVILTIYDTQNH